MPADTDFTYPEVGASLNSVLPAGYYHLKESGVVGKGAGDLHFAAVAILDFRMHRGAGFKVDAPSATARRGDVIVPSIGLGRLRFKAPCKVIEVFDESTRKGFVYGTLAGHPEVGEEAFIVKLAEDQTVTMTVTAFSNPAQWYTRLGGPIARIVQRASARRYIAAVAAAVDEANV